MSTIEYVTIIYAAIISLAAFAITSVDKVSAMRHTWRIRESMLFLIAILGGAFIMYLTMQLIHHKTRHKRFMIGLPIIFILQGLLAYIIIY